MVKYRYEMIKAVHGSDLYGPCEVCKKYVKAMYSQMESRRYKRPDGSTGWTMAGCHDHIMGHKACLMKKRRKK